MERVVPAEGGTLTTTVRVGEGSFAAGVKVCNEVVEPVYVEVIVTSGNGAVPPGVEMPGAGTLTTTVPGAAGSSERGVNVCRDVVDPV